MTSTFNHPWENFLTARAAAIDWMYSGEGDPACKGNDAAIAQTLSMVPIQVEMIRTRNRSLDTEQWHLAHPEHIGVKSLIAGYLADAKQAHDVINSLVKGKRVRITGQWRDQPFGHSKPLQTGKIVKVEWAHIDVHSGVSLSLESYSCSISLDDVEFVE